MTGASALEAICCFVCKKDISSLSVDERERHVNVCLDENLAAEYLQDDVVPSVEKDTKEKSVTCFLCSKNISHLSLLLRESHVNRCVEAAETMHELEQRKVQEVQGETCHICGKAQSSFSLQERVKHTRKCLRESASLAVRDGQPQEKRRKTEQRRAQRVTAAPILGFSPDQISLGDDLTGDHIDVTSLQVPTSGLATGAHSSLDDFWDNHEEDLRKHGIGSKLQLTDTVLNAMGVTVGRRKRLMKQVARAIEHNQCLEQDRGMSEENVCLRSASPDTLQENVKIFDSHQLASACNQRKKDTRNEESAPAPCSQKGAWDISSTQLLDNFFQGKHRPSAKELNRSKPSSSLWSLASGAAFSRQELPNRLSLIETSLSQATDEDSAAISPELPGMLTQLLDAMSDDDS